jgi:small multidrug resistance pump
MNQLFLALSILTEVIATSALKAADGFTRLTPSLVVVLGYAASFYFFSLTLRVMSLGVVYAIWSGAGTALVTLIGVLYYKQALDLAGLLGIGLIVAGVIVLNLFSKSLGS